MLLSVCYPLLSALLISSILLQQKDRLTRRWMRTVAWVWTESVWWTGSVFYEPVPDSRLTKGWVFAHAGLIVLGRSREKGAKLSVSSQHWLASGPVTVSDCVRVCVRGKWRHVSDMVWKLEVLYRYGHLIWPMQAVRGHTSPKDIYHLTTGSSSTHSLTLTNTPESGQIWENITK